MQRKVNLNKNEFQKLSAKRSKLKFAFAIISLLIILVLIGAGIGFNWYKGNLEAPSIAGNNISFEVKEGDTLQSIAPSLEEKGIIKSTLALKIYLRLNNLNPQIKAGKYELPTNKKLEEIIELLENGVYTSTAKVTIIEGSKSEDIAEIIDLKMQSTGNDYNFDKDQFMDIVLNPDQYQFKSSIQEFLDENKPIGKPLRGFLYPDTYFLDTKMQTIEVVEFLIDNLILKIKNANITESSYQTEEITNFYNALILASIIEKEASYKDDKALISSVFHNRLKFGYVLGADSTINFITGQTSKNLNTQIDSEYNTYKNLGLPPTPINNPQIDSIVAAIKPKDSNYFFFFHDDEGNTYYSETDYEHTQKVCAIRGCN